MLDALFGFLQSCVLLVLLVALVPAITSIAVLAVAVARDAWRS